MPFDGANPYSIVILDNASVHHVLDGITDMIQEVGALVMYLLPYSPDYNLIEELFFKLKSIKSYERELQSQAMTMEDIVLSSFCHITAEDCCNWIANSGICIKDLYHIAWVTFQSHSLVISQLMIWEWD